ncbi:MAG TPA: hypothetical protein VEP68_06320 [Anaeromyxobacteraceae bacterium]|nr:hypothetical protein [Anaeromyxobacteraceae bacterium]
MALTGRGGWRWRRAAALAALAVAAAGCGKRAEAPAGRGRRLAEGQVRALSASPDGAWLAWLDRCAQPPARGLPADVLSCDLRVAPAAGGEARRLAEGVTTLPGGLAWSPDGRALAALADYDYGSSAGGLVLWRAGGEARRLAGAVGFYGFAPSGDLWFVAGGQLHRARPGAEPAAVARAGEVATFDLGPAGSRWGLARRRAAAGGALLVLREGEVVAEVPGPVGDYAFSPGGDLVAFTVSEKDGLALRVGAAGPSLAASPVVGRRVQSFAFSRDGSALAWVADLRPGRAGDLWLAPAAAPRGGSRLAAGVGEFRWAAAAPRLAWLQDFDPRMRSGTLAAAGVGGKPAVLGHNVTAYDLTPDGSRAAFLEHVTAGGYSVDLKLGRAEAGAAAETVARGVFGFDFSPQGDWLYYRANCVRAAEACDLFRVPATGAEPGAPPQRLAEGVKSFEFDRRRPGRLLVGWARKDLVALDLAVWEQGRLLSVDRAAVPGSAAFLAPDGARLAYALAEPKRAGVYVADLR